MGPMRSSELGVVIFGLLFLAAVIASFVFARRWRMERARSAEARRQFDAEKSTLTRHYDHLTRYASDAIILFNANLQVIDANDKALSLYGYSLDEFRRLTAVEFLPRSERESLQAAVQWVNEVGSTRYETVHVDAKGRQFPVETTLRALETDTGTGYQNIIRDVSERKESEAILRRLNRVYALLAKVNQVLFQMDDEGVAFRRVCELAKAEGGYALALVVVTDENQVAKVIASEGVSAEGVASVTLDVFQTASSNTITARAIRDGCVQVSNDYLTESKLASLSNIAKTLRMHSIAACPLRRGGRVIGALTLGACERDFFRTEEIQTLEVLAADVSNALDMFTARRKLNEAHERIEQQFTAIEQSPVSVVITDTKGTIEYVNPKFIEVTGYTSEEAVGQNPRVLKSGDLSAEAYSTLWRTIVSGRVWRGEFHNRRKTGEFYWESATIAPVRNEAGKIVRFVALKEDITELKAQREVAGATQKKLEEAEQQFRSMFEEAPIPYHEIDAEGNVVRVNRAECELLGVEASDLIGKPIWNSISPDLQARSQDDIRRKISGDLRLEVFTREFVLADGSVATLEIHDRLVRDAQGKTRGIRSALLDVTLRNTAQEALKRALILAQEASRTKSQFLNVMSHELRTPINGILGLTDILLGSATSSGQIPDLTALRECGAQLLETVQRILDLTEVESGSLRLVPVVFQPRAVLATSVSSLTGRIEAKQLGMIIRVADGVPEKLSGDAARLEQVLRYLLDNAIKFTEEGELAVAVDVEAIYDDTALLRFSVSDTGIGIPVALRAGIFEPFVQADMSDTRRHGGVGLGLSIAAKLVNLMGGRIWLESRAGPGSTFHFNAPFELR